MNFPTALLALGILIIAAAVGVGCDQGRPTATPPLPPEAAGPTVSVTRQGTTVAAAPATATPETPATPGTTPPPPANVVPRATPFLLPTPTAAAPAQPLSNDVDGYIAIAPQSLQPGRVGSVSVSLFDGEAQARGIVRVSLDADEKASASALIEGAGAISLVVPQLPPGEYRLTLEGPGFRDGVSVRVEPGASLFLETDKPIYKPGQKVMMRALAVDPELRPLPERVTVEVQDAKGSKVFKKTVAAGDFGMATVEMPLSGEPNLGVWKISASAGDARAEVDVRVEEYVLPKYEVEVELPRDWALAGDKITGRVAAEYTFGKPVRGEMEIAAFRYVGVWEEFARVTRDIDGSGAFELPPAGYVAGVPGQRGMGNVRLEAAVREKATGYEETATRLLTVAQSPVNLHLISESAVFKPSLPISILVVAETPDNQPLERRVNVRVGYVDKNFIHLETREQRVTTRNGVAALTVRPPEGAVGMDVMAEAAGAHASLSLRAGYSPTGSFIHVVQEGPGALNVGDVARFRVHSTGETANYYYEVVARGKVVFSQVADSPEISFPVTPIMAPGSRLLVYQSLPNNEVAADYIPFEVAAVYPHPVEASFSSEQVGPGDAVDIRVQTRGASQVGLAAVDRSVFILAENRLNLQQVFDKLERLYMQPQAELHDFSFRRHVTTRGARETFREAGVLIMTNRNVPEGRKFEEEAVMAMAAAQAVRESAAAAAPTSPPVAASQPPSADAGGEQPLAEVQRIRRFFPETWLWSSLTTGADGLASLPVEAPDSVTTWVLRAVAMSKEHGLGISESSLKVFQPFFLSVDLPFSGIRGEELPARVALYNYLDTAQRIRVEIAPSDKYQLLDSPSKTVVVGPNDTGGAEFRVRLTDVGKVELEVSARSAEAADAVIKEMLVEPEGAGREVVENLVLAPRESHAFDGTFPPNAVDDSARTLVSVTGSYLAQTIDGLEGLLRMPFGCGEQNMILFAPNVFVANYLRDTGQVKPEVMAKAESLMITGYQRELTYRRRDGSFSAFGDSDASGSLWLTAFVLKTFAQAKGMIYVDPDVLAGASSWILDRQRNDGSFEPVGFLHHQELLGGLRGNTALTAYVAIALLESGETGAASRAIGYLEGELDGIDDPYAAAIVSYALELAGSDRSGAAYDKLMSMAVRSDDGLSWGGGARIAEKGASPAVGIHPPGNRSAAVETTGYATLALLERGDLANASRAGKWLVNQRNAYGGYGSTQDTVVGLQALTGFAAKARADVDMTVELTSGGWSRTAAITPENADVLQIFEVPAGAAIRVEGRGKGQAVVQAVRRFNVPEVAGKGRPIFDIDVDYGADSVDVDDLITVSARVSFNPPQPVEAGMVVLDIAIPTGFAPTPESLERMVEAEPKIKRRDVAGRKVIIYIEDMAAGEKLSLQFQARALFPVKAEPATSSVYSYYKPEWKGESLGGAMIVGG